jgi:glycosyltransferase involved in cell wall biosynthesis
VIRNEKNGLLVAPPKDDPASLYAALDKLLRDADLRAKLGHNGAAIVQSEYTVAAFQQSLERVITKLLT